MTSPADRRYTKTHEWVSLDGDVATIGITDFAQTELGDITYLELPEVGDAIALDQAFGIIESVKAANDIYLADRRRGGRTQRRGVGGSGDASTQSPYRRGVARAGDASVNRNNSSALMDAEEYDAFAQSAGTLGGHDPN